MEIATVPVREVEAETAAGGMAQVTALALAEQVPRTEPETAQQQTIPTERLKKN
ncbi:MAG: hypothetical protein ACNI3A_17495 [Desulfovibrio sp.]|uniref:hypothetical protein n=1 Tax=Desulfovibrio sp. 7SRBS1 TaxID=3378064 RepID=UPI003B41CC3C